MADKVVKPDRRRVQRRLDRLASTGASVEDSSVDERRTHCWDLDPECDESRRKQCAAYFVRRNCWDLWAAEYFPPGRKPCCHSNLDCSECPVAGAKFQGPVSVYLSVSSSHQTSAAITLSASRSAIHCPYLYTVREAVSGHDEESRQLFRCQRRRAVQLHSTYVSEVCGSPEHRDCPFFAPE